MSQRMQCKFIPEGNDYSLEPSVSKINRLHKFIRLQSLSNYNLNSSDFEILVLINSFVSKSYLQNSIYKVIHYVFFNP